VRKRSRWQ